VNSTKLISTYSKALFRSVNTSSSPQSAKKPASLGKLIASSEEPTLSTVYLVAEELTLLRAMMVTSTKLKEFFTNPTYSEKQKLQVISTVYPGLTVTTKSFLEILTERSHLSLLPTICEEYLEILLKFQNSTKVRLVVGSILQKKSGKALLGTLKKLTNSQSVILTLTYSPKLLGGLILEYNSTLIDASILNEFSLFFTEA